jgi:hypothetical protein
MNFKMKTRFLALAAALLCCYSCIETNSTLGGNLVPTVETYTFYTAEIPLEGISMQMADNLSGYSDSRMTIGAIREPEYGLTTRASAITLVPLFMDELNMGKDPVFKRFHFSAATDTTSFLDPTQENILQRVHVYALESALDPEIDYDINRPIPHGSKIISKGTPVYNGVDSLTFDFSEEFGKKYLSITADDLKDIETYLAKFPGIYLETEIPQEDGGRIDMLDVQMAYDKDYGYILGNVATLNYNAEFDGVRKDTTVLFWYGATEFFDLDSLFEAYTGTFPQYALNYTGQTTRSRTGDAHETISIEGGGGLKPVISALSLKHQVEEAIAQVGGDPKEAIINKASLIFPFEFPEDYKDMTFWPYRLSPTCRLVNDETTAYMGLTDASSSSENQGDVDRSLMRYAPDITYHMQELIKIDETAVDKNSTKNLLTGNYDIWLLVMAQELQTTVTTASKEQQEMLNYLAYSSYYNGMYGGYGYGGYGSGYGSYGSYYNNYLTYAMMAQQASMSQTSTSTIIELDTDRFYRAALNGPDSNSTPTIKVVFALPNKED